MKDELRSRLLQLHAAIVAVEREDFERSNGVVGATEFLRVLAEDPAWAWLRELSTLVVRLEKATIPPQEIRSLLKPDSAGTPFQQHYAWLFERSPDVVFAHGAVMRALSAGKEIP